MRLVCSLIFILFGYVMMLMSGFATENLVVFLLALLTFSLKMVFSDKKIVDLLAAALMLSVFFDLHNIMFIPIIIFAYEDIEKYKYRLVGFIGAISVYYYAVVRMNLSSDFNGLAGLNYPEDSIFLYNYCISLLMIVASGFLSYALNYIVEADKKFLSLRDDSVEYEALLEEKNKALIEKQDYVIYTTMLKERNRIAREIHDNIGHSLSRLILLVGAMKSVDSKRENSHITESIDLLDETLKNTMTEVRTSVHDLHDDGFNLKEEVDKLIKDFSFCEVKLTYDANFELPNAIKYNFITVIKEALVNVVKHSNADEVKIIIREHPSMYQLIILDNGDDIDRGKIDKYNCETAGEFADIGIGIENMKERIKSIGGNLMISTERGFKIHIVIQK